VSFAKIIMALVLNESVWSIGGMMVTDGTKLFRERPIAVHFVYHRCHIDWCGIDLGRLK
jgi:hypothetical protein